MAFQWPDGTQDITQERIASILWALHMNEGSVWSEAGHASAELDKVCKKFKVRWPPKSSPGWTQKLVATLCGEREDSPYHANPPLAREITGRRTYLYKLLCDEDDLPDPILAWTERNMPARVKVRWYDDVTTDEPSTEEPQLTEFVDGHEVEVVDVPIPDVIPQPVAEDQSTIMSRLIAMQGLVTDLMIDFAALAAEIGEGNDHARLLDENEHLKAQIAEYQQIHRNDAETIGAKAKEIEALRSSLRQTQGNVETLRKAVQANGHGFDELDRQRKVLDQLMRQPSRSTL